MVRMLQSISLVSATKAVVAAAEEDLPITKPPRHSVSKIETRKVKINVGA